MAHAVPSLRLLIQWYHDQNRQLPWRAHWVKTRDPYGVWVSEVMLQQTVIKVVIPVYLKFMDRFPTVYGLAKASEEELREAVRGLGYYRRFRMMHACARQLVEQAISHAPQDSQLSAENHLRDLWPIKAAALRELPGIGAYTSAAISSIAFRESVAVVDGNVERVLCRLEGLSVQPKDPKVKKQLQKIAQDYLEKSCGDSSASSDSFSLERAHGGVLPGDHNQAMMELGQLICTPLQPRCHLCPLAEQCLGYLQGCQEQIPLPAVRKAPRSIFLSMKIPLKTVNGVVFVGLFRRGSHARFLKDSWGFLSDWRHGPDQATPKRLTQEALGPTEGNLLGSFRHSITDHRLSVDVYSVKAVSGDLLSKEGWHRDSMIQELKWVSSDLVEPQLMANLDRKAWKLYIKNLESNDAKRGRMRQLRTGMQVGGNPKLLL